MCTFRQRIQGSFLLQYGYKIQSNFFIRPYDTKNSLTKTQRKYFNQSLYVEKVCLALPHLSNYVIDTRLRPSLKTYELNQYYKGDKWKKPEIYLIKKKYCLIGLAVIVCVYQSRRVPRSTRNLVRFPGWAKTIIGFFCWTVE